MGGGGLEVEGGAHRPPPLHLLLKPYFFSTGRFHNVEAKDKDAIDI